MKKSTLTPKDVIDTCLAAFEDQQIDIEERTRRILEGLKMNGYEISKINQEINLDDSA